MMVHLFMDRKESDHLMFKRAEAVPDSGIIPQESGEEDVLYIYRDYVGFYEGARQFVLVPNSRVLQIRFTREAGQRWSSGAGFQSC